jgi:thiol-disulfide isomerase/thioredoxin
MKTLWNLLFTRRAAGLVPALILTWMTIPSVQAIQLGDPAPALNINQWVKGQPVDLKAGQGKAIYVVEFWATWCGPCRASIPHLSQVQAQFKDKNVTIIGVTDEKPSVVNPFLKQMGDKMDYTVAIDKEGQTYASFMGAFGINGIPHAFIISKEGNLVWQGHPMDGLESALEQILAGTYDIEAARKAAQTGQLIPQYIALIGTGKKSPEVEKMGRQIVAGMATDAEKLNDFAWYILTNPRARYRDLDLAMDTAKKAYDATGGKDASVLETYARALFDTGKVNEAIQAQKQAIAAADDKDLKSSLEETLDRYQRSAKGK